MTRSEIIELANQLSERKGEKVLNLQSLFRFVVQDIAKRNRFWWRRGLITFTLSSGTVLYDLTQITTIPANALNEIAVEEITKFSVLTASSPQQFNELTPIFDPQALVEMVANTTATQPTRYTAEALDYKTLRVDPPDNNYTAYLVFWAMPNPATESPTDSVPLIPPWGHNAIVSGLCAKIFKFAYGSKNEKTIDAVAEYEQAILDLAMRPKFDPNYRLQLASGEDAVRST